MTLSDFLELQQQLFNAFGWFIRWWLIVFAALGICATALVSILTATRSMIDKS